MTRIQRQAITAAGLLAVFAPMTAMAQGGRGQVRTPIFIAVNFRSPAEPKLGVEVAEAMRQRMLRFFPTPPRPGQLQVVPAEKINQSLVNSGYPADSVISTSDLRDLGKGAGAEETLEGTAKRVAGGVEASAKFYSLNIIGAPEVLPVVT